MKKVFRDFIVKIWQIGFKVATQKNFKNFRLFCFLESLHFIDLPAKSFLQSSQSAFYVLGVGGS